MWTDETRILKSHKGWSLCGVPVNVWIGSGAYILKSVTIGEGADWCMYRCC